MIKNISISDETWQGLDKIAPKDEEGNREETYNQTILRLLREREYAEKAGLVI